MEQTAPKRNECRDTVDSEEGAKIVLQTITDLRKKAEMRKNLERRKTVREISIKKELRCKTG